jgi:hypothetical protein
MGGKMFDARVLFTSPSVSVPGTGAEMPCQQSTPNADNRPRLLAAPVPNSPPVTVNVDSQNEIWPFQIFDEILEPRFY